MHIELLSHLSTPPRKQGSIGNFICWLPGSPQLIPNLVTHTRNSNMDSSLILLRTPVKNPFLLQNYCKISNLSPGH